MCSLTTRRMCCACTLFPQVERKWTILVVRAWHDIPSKGILVVMHSFYTRTREVGMLTHWCLFLCPCVCVCVCVWVGVRLPLFGVGTVQVYPVAGMLFPCTMGIALCM